jgi:glutamate-1-semialdehyde 2,1-aminomutase
MISVFFTHEAVNNFTDASSSNITMFNKFFHAMLNEGIYLPPSAYESWFLSNALNYDDLNATITFAANAMKKF